MQPIGAMQGASPAAGNSQSDNRRIEKSSRDFETLLLSNWLEKAYDSFGTMPGAEDDGELDSGKEQLSSISMQSLAGAMTATGGVGIAKMIANHLHHQSDTGGSGSSAGAASEKLKSFSAQDAELSAKSSR